MNKRKELIIAIIDTGIAHDFTYIEDVVDKYDFFIENKALYISEGSDDRIGHGTKVASCIKKYCPSALLYVINIYKYGDITYSLLLLEALNYLLTVDVDIINISLAVNSDTYISEIDSVLKRLSAQGKIIVSAVKNGLKTSFPAESPYCIGVLGLENIPIGTFLSDENRNIQIITSRLPEMVETLQGEQELFGGNSKAAACVSGSIAALMSEKRNYDFTIDSACRELKNKMVGGERTWIVS